MVALDADDARCVMAPHRQVGLELAASELRLEVRTANIVLEGLRAVHPMLDVFAASHDARAIPVWRKLRDASGRCVEAVRGAGRRQRVLAVRRQRIVRKLKLDRRPIDLALTLVSANEHARIAG